MMYSEEQSKRMHTAALETLEKAHILLTEEEKQAMEICDLGLGREDIGMVIHIYVSTERCSAKELVLMPGQTCPEHRHPPLSAENPGKEETFRCRYGTVYLYVEGPPTPAKAILARIPEGKENVFTVARQIVLQPGGQYILPPNTKHWFQAGPEGCVVSEFSTKNVDEEDVYTDPQIRR